MMTMKWKPVVLKFLLVFALSALCGFYAFVRQGRPNTGIDDADIFMVYGKNLAQGHGFVYNIGDERVEGFSSLLYVILVAAFFKLTKNPEHLILLFNLVAVALALTAIVNRIDKLEKPPGTGAVTKRPFLSLASMVFLVWTFSSPAYITWTTFTLMDTGLWSALLLCFCLITSLSLSSRSLKHRFLASLVIVLMVLARPEALFWIPVVLLFFSLVLLWRERKLKPVYAFSFVPVTVFLLTTALLILFRITYFGYPLPNTYYTKVSPNILYNLYLGLEYFHAFATSSNFLRLATAAIVLSVFVSFNKIREKKLPESNRFLLAVSFFVIVGLFVPITYGGDYFDWFRFYQPVWPLMVIPLFWPFKHRIEKYMHSPSGVSRLQWGLTGALAILFSLEANPSWYKWSDTNLTLFHEFTIARDGRRLGDAMNQVFDGIACPDVGVITAGGVKYTYQGKIVDLMGLNNLAMAHHSGDRYGIKNHASFNKEVFYRQVPRVMVPVVVDNPAVESPYDNDRWWDATLKGLLREDAFHSQYTLVNLKKLSSSDAVRLCAYIRNDYLLTLKNSGAYKILTKTEAKPVPETAASGCLSCVGTFSVREVKRYP